MVITRGAAALSIAGSTQTAPATLAVAKRSVSTRRSSVCRSSRIIRGTPYRRLRPNCAVNYGFRWDYNGVPYEGNGQMSTLVNQNPSGTHPAGGFEFQE